MLSLKESYQKEITKKMIDKFKYKNVFSVPKVEKVVVNVGVGEARENPKILEFVEKDLSIIIGQKPAITKAKKAISGFKIRKGDKIGMKVTLRGKRMYDFLERLTRIALPRIRDFRGLSKKGFDGHGNYNLGLKEHAVFAEIKYDKTEKFFGFQVTVGTNAKSNEEAEELLTLMGFPFEHSNK
jgi:large subunit ribosomal protein L5